MKNHHQKVKEQGQIIILLAVSLVVVMVVAALAVDGGMIYSERRFAQNAADAAGFAGGGAVLNSGKLDEVLTCPVNSSGENNLVAIAVSAAQSRASANNISALPFLGYLVNDVVKEDYGLDQNQGVIIECNDDGEMKMINVVVRVTSQISTAFAHLIYPGPLQTTNEAMVSVSQVGTQLNGDAIISLSNDCNNNGNQNKNIGGVLLNSNNLDITVINAGIFSNSCLYVKNQSNSTFNDSLQFNIFGNVTGTDPDQTVITSKVVKVINRLPGNFPNPDKPNCDGVGTGTTTTGTEGGESVTYFWPGKYNSGISIQNGKKIFKPGLFCLNSDLEFTGGDVSGGNVTFYLSENATIKNTGNSNIKLVAPTNPSDPNYGLLFYIDGDGSITWNGTNSSHYNGLVYAPKRNLQISGNSNNTSGTCPVLDGLPNICDGINYPTQIIGYQVIFTGSSLINITNPEDSSSALSNNLFLKQ
ncbi:MAG TPA: pilus assembly protein TadG-related protein [Anaerolineaceae bacterium]|nr:pilus assembly protein TadG-related protein [Anaerolineaceae bacterium]